MLKNLESYSCFLSLQNQEKILIFFHPTAALFEIRIYLHHNQQLGLYKGSRGTLKC